MKLRLRVQRHLVVGNVADDEGHWVFTVCRRGMSEMLNTRLLPGDELLVDLEGAILERLNDEQGQKRSEEGPKGE